jgi:drug/metabolite transporter (DMT)-like permease
MHLVDSCIFAVLKAMKSPVDLNLKGWQFAVLLVLSFIWGTSFILMKRGLETFSPLQLAALRVTIAFAVVSPLAIRNIRLLNRKNLFSLLIAGYLGIGFPAILFSTAQKHIDSSLAGVLNSLTPLFTLIFGMVLYRNTYRLYNLLGVFIGFIGASTLILGTTGYNPGDINIYALLVMLATAFYGINVNEIKNKLAHLNGLEVTSLAFLTIVPVAITYLLFSDFSAARANPLFWRSLLAVAALAVFGSALAVILFNYFLHYTTAVFASSVTYIIPVFAILWGLFDGERLGWDEIVPILIILIGIWLVNRNGNQKNEL